MNACIPMEYYEAARDCLSYNQKTGSLVWSTSRSRRAPEGSEAGAYCPRGYLMVRITIDGKSRRMQASRVIWFIVHGSMSEQLHVDHINRIKSDNRLSNLRACTPSQNHRNKEIKRNTSGVVGVNKSSTNRWRVRINVDGVKVPLGNFKSFDEAVKVRRAAEVKYFGEYAYKKL